MEKLNEETNNLKGRLVVYEEIKRKYDRERLDKPANMDDDIGSSLYHQRKSSLEKLDQERKNVFY